MEQITLSQQIVQYICTGITIGSIYAMVALGFNIIYNATEVINLAQGEFVMLGGLIMVFFATILGLPLIIAFIFTVVVVMAVGTLFERLAIYPLKGASVLTLIIITIAASILIQGIAMGIWGKDPYDLVAFSGRIPISFLGAMIQPQYLWVLGITVIVVILLEAPYILDHVFPGLPYYFSIIISGTAPLIYFPIIPWLIYIILGTVVGELFLKAQSQDNLEVFLIPAALIGGALTVLGLVGRPYAVYFDPQELWQTEFSHPPLSQMVFAVGMLLLLFAGLCFLYQRRETVSALEPLEMVGRESFFIYIAHHPLGYSVFGLLDKHNAFGFVESTVMLLVTCVLFSLFLRYLPGLTRRIHSIID